MGNKEIREIREIWGNTLMTEGIRMDTLIPLLPIFHFIINPQNLKNSN